MSRQWKDRHARDRRAKSRKRTPAVAHHAREKTQDTRPNTADK